MNRATGRQDASRASEGGRKRILVVSASVGGGHDGAAFEFARQLRRRGYEVTVRDYLDALPLRSGRLIRWFYAHQLRYAPGSYQALYETIARFSALLRLTVWFACWACPRLRTWAAGCDGVVTTYPLAGQAAARLRRRGLTAAVVVFLTDFSVHPLWVAHGADLHLVLHEVTAAQVTALAPTVSVRIAGAAVRTDFTSGELVDRLELRRRYGISPDSVVALLVAGSWGVGEVAAAAREVASDGDVVPIIVCGRNQALQRQLEREGLGIPLGWVDDMAGLMRGCDVLVQNAGGLTSLEAMAVGLPIVSYRCLPGHGRTNADAMTQAGVALHACGSPSVGEVLRQLDQRRCDELRDRASELFRGDPAGMIVAAVSASPDPAQRRRSARMTRRFAAALVALLFTVIASSSIGHRPTAWTSVMHQLRRWSTGVHIPGTGSHTHRGY